MKEAKFKLDDISVEILNKLNPIHINSIVNYAIRKLKNDKYYEILTGIKEADDEIENEENLNQEELEENKKENIKTKNDEDEDLMSFSW